MMSSGLSPRDAVEPEPSPQRRWTPDDLFSIRVKEGRVVVSGEIDGYSAPALAEVLREFGRSQDQIRLDLSGVTFIDSSGLHALLRLRDALPVLHVVVVSARVARLLEMTGTTDLVVSETDPAAE